MNKYTRKYYIDGKETSLPIVLKYIEIGLTHGTLNIGQLGVTFKDVKMD
jgi:predicted branched-subunit amino acid permease